MSRDQELHAVTGRDSRRSYKSSRLKPLLHALQLGTCMIRAASHGDFPAILTLNDESVRYTSPMDTEELGRLHAQSAYHRVIDIDGEIVAFLLALREGADYRSPNYGWFSRALPSFLYIDRIVVASAHQGRRLGALLYDDLFAYASDAGIPVVACEFDIEPPNEPSRRFHARYGFEQVGTQWVADGKKRVSLQVAAVANQGGGTADPPLRSG